jgi:hypothetical protein
MKQMKSSRRQIWLKALLANATGVAVIGLGFVASYSTPAVAQAAYGSYIGVGPAFGITEGSRPEDDRKVVGVIAARYKFLKAPVSARAQAFVGSGVTLVPTISYDYPLNWQTDVYLGAGASIPLGGNTILGSKTSFAIQPGIDYALPNSNAVVFCNAVISFGGYKGGGTAASLQGGVGLRF